MDIIVGVESIKLKWRQLKQKWDRKAEGQKAKLFIRLFAFIEAWKFFIFTECNSIKDSFGDEVLKNTYKGPLSQFSIPNLLIVFIFFNFS